MKKELQQQQQQKVKIDRLQLVPFDYMNNVTNRSVARTQYKEVVMAMSLADAKVIVQGQRAKISGPCYPPTAVLHPPTQFH